MCLITSALISIYLFSEKKQPCRHPLCPLPGVDNKWHRPLGHRCPHPLPLCLILRMIGSFRIFLVSYSQTKENFLLVSENTLWGTRKACCWNVSCCLSFKEKNRLVKIKSCHISVVHVPVHWKKISLTFNEILLNWTVAFVHCYSKLYFVCCQSA